MPGMLYTVDACCLIKAWGVYPPDIFTGFWQKLETLIQKRTISANEEVLEELRRKDDAVLAWAEMQEDLFTPIDAMLQQQVLRVLAEHPGLYDIEKNKSGADPFVVAEALLNGYVVVTEEKRTRDPAHAKIPDVCEAYGIRCIDLLTLLREQGFKLMIN